VKAWMKELLEAWLVELLKREYAFATIMFTKLFFLQFDQMMDV
jgi:hypothetical protein